MELWLVDINPELVNAWQKEFADCENVYVECDDILKLAEDTIVSPANSYGRMDGGIDLEYTEYFGLTPQDEIQKLIALRPEGYLPVGAAVLVKTGHKKIPYMISAPTMVQPGIVYAVNVFFAMSAILQVISQHKNSIKKVYCPGLATGIGRVPYETAAMEMAMAYHKWKKRLKMRTVDQPMTTSASLF